MADLDRLAQALLDQGKLTREQIERAVELQREFGASLGQIIVRLGYMDERELIGFMAAEHGLEVVDVEELILPENLIKRLPRKLIEKHCVLPIEYHEGVLTIACSDPYDMQALDEIQMALEARVKLNLAPRSAIRRVVQQHFGGGAAATGGAAAAGGAEKWAELAPALIPLLVQKGIVTEEELRAKAREMGLLK